MTGPAWLPQVLAAVMLLIAVGGIASLAIWVLRRRGGEPEADTLHAVMGVAMAGMLEPRFRAIPGTAWLAVFAGAAAWFSVRALRDRGRNRGVDGPPRNKGGWRCAHPAPHCVECAAMIYMLLPARSAGYGSRMAMGGMATGPTTANPALALVLALFMLGFIIWTADRFTSQRRTPSAAAGREAPASRTAAFSKIAMSLAMGYMLVMTL
jgi:hypothetical protein